MPGPGCGVQDDGLIYVPPDYVSFLPPAQGESYTDPVFGCSIMRLTDGLAQFGTAVHHEYASMSPLNSSNSRILLLTETGTLFVVDRQGNVVVSPSELNLAGASEPRWSVTDPNVFYFHEGNQLLQYHVSRRERRVVHTFTEYTAINFGGGEGDISDDGDHLVIVGDDRFMHVYQFSTDTVGPALDAQGNVYDWFDLTPSNNVLARWFADGPDRFQGIELYDKNMNFIRQVVPWGGHADRGRDLDGEEVLVIVASNDPSPPPGCETSGVEKVRLSDGQETCLLPLYWGESTHISLNNRGRHPWVLVSNTASDATTNPPATLPEDWRARWGRYYNELILVKLDGTEVRRLAHHRSRRLDGYWHTPRAVLSRNAAWAVFDSNFAQYPVANYTDVFLLSVWGTPCGLPDDKAIRVPPHYTSLKPPARGQTFADPLFGCSITRLSDGVAQFDTAVHHEYASMSPLNSDNSRILLLTETGAFFVVDRQGDVVVSPSELAIAGWSEPRWSITNPNVFYFHEGNQLEEYDLSNQRQAVVRTFSEYTAISFGGGEADISEDGDHLVIIGDNRFVHVYQFSTDTLGAVLDLQGKTFDWFDMTPNNNVLANFGANGTDRFQGMELFDKNMNFIRQVIPFVGHADRGRDLNGDEIVVVVASNDLNPAPGCEGNGVEKVRLSDSQKTCLLPLYWGESTHISINNEGGHPWALVSNTAGDPTPEPPQSLPGNWPDLWRKHYNELTLVRLDGTEVYRLAHHRSRRFGWYWYTPRAALSRDGSLAVFDSTHAEGAPSIPEYTDAYLLTVRTQR